MIRTFACCIALTLTGIARAEERPTTIRVTTADGKPAVKAKAWVNTYAEIGKEPVEPKPVVCDDDGKAIVHWSKKPNPYPDVFLRDASGRVGSAPLSRTQSGIDEDSILDIVLLDTAARSGRVTDSRGKPIVGAVVAVMGITPMTGSAAKRDPRRRSHSPNGKVPRPASKWTPKAGSNCPHPKRGTRSCSG